MSAELTAAQMDEKFDSFRISEQSERIIELIQDNGLNHNSGFSVDVLRDSLKRFEFDQPTKAVSTGNKTAALLGVVAQTVYEKASLQPDGTYKLPEDKNEDDLHLESLATDDFNAINEATYNDPIANPLRREVGGYFNIDMARIDLIREIPLKSNVFAAGIPTNQQDQILAAIGDLPVHVQQLAAQGLKQAAQDAKHNTHFGGHKTASANYVKSVIQDQLTGFDNFERSNRGSPTPRSFSDAFNNSLYDAKGAARHADRAANPDLASNKPPAQITAPIQDSFSDMMRDGINREIDQLHHKSQLPHTLKGDKQMQYETELLLDNTKDFINALSKNLESPERDKTKDIHFIKAFSETTAVVDNALDLVKEMPIRNLELEATANEVKQHISDHKPDAEAIINDIKLREQAENTVTQPTASAPTMR